MSKDSDNWVIITNENEHKKFKYNLIEINLLKKTNKILEEDNNNLLKKYNKLKEDYDNLKYDYLNLKFNNNNLKVNDNNLNFNDNNLINNSTNINYANIYKKFNNPLMQNYKPWYNILGQT